VTHPRGPRTTRVVTRRPLSPSPAGRTASERRCARLTCGCDGGCIRRRAGVLERRLPRPLAIWAVRRAWRGVPRRASRSGVLAPARSLHLALPRAGGRLGFDARRPSCAGGMGDARDWGLTRLHSGSSQDVASGEGGGSRVGATSATALGLTLAACGTIDGGSSGAPASEVGAPPVRSPFEGAPRIGELDARGVRHDRRRLLWSASVGGGSAACSLPFPGGAALTLPSSRGSGGPFERVLPEHFPFEGAPP